jgi:hypothetical protein
MLSSELVVEHAQSVFFLGVREHFSQKYKTAGKVIVLYIFTWLNRRLEEKRL